MTIVTGWRTHIVFSRRFFSRLEPWLYLAPSLVLITGILLIPLAIGLSYAFRDIQLLDPLSGGFIGFEHFYNAWHDENVWRALRNTLVWTSAAVLLQFILGLILALLLNRAFWGRPVVRALIFLPWAVPAFLSGLNWAWLFNPAVGPIPHWLTMLGMMQKPENILSDPDLALWGPIIAIVWWGIPFFALMLLAALQSIPKDIYEAAAIDGAGTAQQFWLITLPFLAPVIAITVLLRAVWISNSADLIIVMTRGGPADSTQILATYVLTQAFERLDFGYASAIAVILLILLLGYGMAILALRHRMYKAG